MRTERTEATTAHRDLKVEADEQIPIGPMARTGPPDLDPHARSVTTANALNRPATDRRGHAVVVGAGMSGLLTARVLADHFRHVTLVERDRLPGGPDFRNGVPQARHVHALLKGGLIALEQLFPGFEASLLGHGAIRVEAHEFLLLTAAGFNRRFHGANHMLSASRELIEWEVRSRVLRLANVRCLEGCDVSGLIAADDGAVIQGVLLNPRGGSRPTSTSTRLLAADLVVDASGADSHTPRWLGALGYPKPEEVTVDGFVGYASRYYAPPDGFRADWKAILLTSTPDNPHGGALVCIEEGRWLVTLVGVGRRYPPTDEQGFLAFAADLRSPVIYEAIKDARPLGPIRGWRRTSNRCRLYESMPRRPECFLVVGDATCSFNPAYGQGMTVAALQALALEGCLREQRRRQSDGEIQGLAPRAQRAVASQAKLAWVLATGVDLRYPTTEGGRVKRLDRLMSRYFDRVVAASTQDRAVRKAFTEVSHLIRPPQSLLRPAVVGRTLLHGWHAPLTTPPPVESSRLRVDGVAGAGNFNAGEVNDLSSVT